MMLGPDLWVELTLLSAPKLLILVTSETVRSDRIKHNRTFATFMIALVVATTRGVAGCGVQKKTSSQTDSDATTKEVTFFLGGDGAFYTAATR